MPKKYSTKSKINIPKIGIYEEPSIAAAKYTEDELASMVKKYADTANARIKRLKKENLLESSAAYKMIVEPKMEDIHEFPYFTKKGTFSLATKGKTKVQMVKELQTLQRFLKSKTSTVSGVNEYIDKATTALVESLKRNDNEYAAKIIEEQRGTSTAAETAIWFRESAYKLLMDIFGSTVATRIHSDIHSEVDNKDYKQIDDLIIEYIQIKGYSPSNVPPEEEFTNNAIDYIKNYNLSDLDENDADIDIGRI